MRVLIPVDGSKYSDYAVALAASSRWLNPTKILLLNVVQPLDSFLPKDLDTQIMLKEQEIVAGRSKLLESSLRRLSMCFPDCKSITSRIKFGNPKKVILDTIVNDSFDVVVLGSHGRSGIEKLILGSVSQAVLEHAPNAVLIAKNKNIDQVGEFHHSSRVLVSYDGSLYSRDAISWLSQRKWSKGTKIHIVMAITDFEHVEKLDLSPEHVRVVQDHWTSIKQGAFEILEEVALNIGQVVGNQNISIDAIAGEPREVISEAIDKFNANLVVLGSHGKTGLDRVMLGSVSTHISQHAPCPVLIVKRLSGIYKPEHEKLEDVAPLKTDLDTGLDERPPFTMF